MLSDIKIAQAAKIKPISEIAGKLGIKEGEIELYGKYQAKISLDILKRIKSRPQGKYILVTAITPTPLGEGKTVTAIGLSMGLNRIGKKASACIRQPSLGPVFGIKGGAAGGGYSQVIPMEDFNLHFTGDVHAVGLANNFCAALLDNSVYKGNKLNIDPATVSWKRCVDISDRFLRHIAIGRGGAEHGFERETGFDITAASEVMAVLAIAKDLADLRQRIGKIVLAFDKQGKCITAEDIKAAGAMTVLLKDAIKPNLIQTLENTPCLVHAGPFANIAPGNSSILADLIALRLNEFVVTEAGFGADCGAEKFMDIKCRYSGLKPDCVVIVCSIRALKMHSGRFSVVAGKPLEPGLLRENVEAVKLGCCNLIRHIKSMLLFGVPVVVAINKFEKDTDKEIETVRKIAKEAGALDAVVSEAWAKGGRGTVELARRVAEASRQKSHFRFLYDLNLPIKEKIKIIAVKIYGANGVEYSHLAEEKIKRFTELGFDKLPICMAKTHLSLSHDPKLKGCPVDFVLPIRDMRASIGAGFLYPLCGTMQTMPGLPSIPAGEMIDINKDGKVIGLF